MKKQPNPNNITSLISQLSTSQDNATLRQAAERLGDVGAGNAEAQRALVQLLQNNQDEINRWSAIKSLGKISTGNSEVIQVLIEQLCIARIPSRRLAAESLGKIAMGNAEAIAALSNLIRNSSDEATRQCASDVLDCIGVKNQEAIDALIYLLYNSSNYTRKKTIGNLTRIDNGSPETIDVLLYILRTGSDSYDDYGIRDIAMHYLSEIAVGNPQVINALTELLHRPGSDRWTEQSRKIAMGGLTKIETNRENYISQMLQFLQNSKNNSEIESVVGYFKYLSISSPEVIEAFLDILRKSEDKNLRRQVLIALRKIATGPATPNTINILNEQLSIREDPLERGMIAGILGNLGAATTETINSLLDILQTDFKEPEYIRKREWIRSEAIYSLGRISTTNPDGVKALNGLLETIGDREDLITLMVAFGKYGAGKPEVIHGLSNFAQNSSDHFMSGMGMFILLAQIGASQHKVIKTFQVFLALCCLNLKRFLSLGKFLIILHQSTLEIGFQSSKKTPER